MKLLANDGITVDAINTLSANGFEILQVKVAQNQLENYINTHQIEVLLIRSATRVTAEIISNCPSLKIIARAGVGLDNIAVSEAKNKGIIVINTPLSSANAVAELTFAHLMGCVRFLYDSNRMMPLEGDTQFSFLKNYYSQGVELRGKTLGIIGFGHIGQVVGKMAISLGMNILACDSSIKKQTLNIELGHFSSVDIDIETVSKEKVLKHSDFITLHLPYNGEICLKESDFLMMKKGAGIINVSRGELIDENDLLNALDNEHLSFAALDVFHNEPSPSVALLMHPKISLSPHIGGSTQESQWRIFSEITEKVIQAKQQIHKKQ